MEAQGARAVKWLRLAPAVRRCSCNLLHSKDRKLSPGTWVPQGTLKGQWSVKHGHQLSWARDVQPVLLGLQPQPLITVRLHKRGCEQTFQPALGMSKVAVSSPQQGLDSFCFCSMQPSLPEAPTLGQKQCMRELRLVLPSCHSLVLGQLSDICQERGARPVHLWGSGRSPRVISTGCRRITKWEKSSSQPNLPRMFMVVCEEASTASGMQLCLRHSLQWLKTLQWHLSAGPAYPPQTYCLSLSPLLLIAVLQKQQHHSHPSAFVLAGPILILDFFIVHTLNKHSVSDGTKMPFYCLVIMCPSVIFSSSHSVPSGNSHGF